MVEFGNSLDPDKEFDVLHGILDFSMDDCLEEGEIAEDWDVGDAQCLGPIPSSILMELPVTSNEELDFASNAVEYYDDNSDGALLQNASGPCAVGNKCAHCQSTKTPLWREGPLGPHTLCNACGLQYRAGCLFPEYRPAASPTFVPSQHSNDRRKIVKMMQSAAGIKIDGAPELAKHVGTSSSIIYPQIARTPEQKQVQHMHVDTSSHVSLLESSCSYSKYGSKHVGTKPSVPPLSPCKKTSCEEKLFEVPIEYDDDNSDGALLQNASNPCPAVIKRCTHCQSTKTEQWREGPLGPHTLCNACGQQYRAGRLVPEYRPHQDSNSHAMPVKMMQSTADIKIAGAPEQRKSARVQEFGSFHTQTAVSVLESSGSCTREKSLSIKSDNAIPARRSKRLRDKGINPELSTSKQTSNARRSKESRKRLPVAMDLMRNSPKNVDNSLNVSDPAYQIASGPCPPLVKKCAHCQSSETTLWRDGPLGPKTLCNACGIRYRSGRLCPEYRPLSSPTFVPSQHSDSHKKVAEMRKEAKRLKVEIKIDEVPDQTQLHVDDTSTHVSLLENSRSYLKFRSKYNNHAGAKPWLPPSSTCEKISGEETSFEMHLDESLYNSDRALLQNGSNPCPPLVKKKKKMKKCAHCGSTKTTLWRSGPLGPSTLCNACGKQYTAGRLVPDYRPKASLTFVLSQHSNKYRTFLQMRAKTINDSLTADIKIAGAPEQQHVEGMHLAKHVETSTHVSLLESSPSYLRYKAKYFKHAGEHAPCVPLPSPCKKTSSVENDDDNSDGALMQNASDPCPAVIKKCAHCESTKTPRWRKGPLGPSTLCSACSDQYRAGCLVPEYRPKASPTFVPGLHSNNRSGILKMMQSAAGIEKRCAHCESTKTSKWTRGPLGPSTLCAACGHQYRAGRLVPEYRPKQVRHSYQASIPTSLQGS